MPLDTNLVEQAIKMIIRYRNNSRTYKTETGAEVGDRLMSLIQIAVINGASPVAYLAWCLEHHEDLAQNPERYFVWTYQRQHAKPAA